MQIASRHRISIAKQCIVFLLLFVSHAELGSAQTSTDLKEMLRFREWTSTADTTVKAQFVELKNGIVVLKTFGDTISVPFAKLSGSDRLFVLSIMELRLVEKATELDQAKSQLAQAQKQASDLKSSEQMLDDQLKTAGEEIDRLTRALAMFKPSKGLKSRDGVPILTAKEIEVYGRDHLNSTVRMLDCSFREVSTTWVDSLPGVTIRSDGLTSVINIREKDKWIGVNIIDNKGEYWSYCFANKEKFAEFFLTIEEGTKLDIEGVLFERARSGGSFGVLITKVAKKTLVDNR